MAQPWNPAFLIAHERGPIDSLSFPKLASVESASTANRQHGARRPRDYSIGHAVAEGSSLRAAASTHDNEFTLPLVSYVENLLHCVAEADLDLRIARLNGC